MYKFEKLFESTVRYQQVCSILISIQISGDPYCKYESKTITTESFFYLTWNLSITQPIAGECFGNIHILPQIRPFVCRNKNFRLQFLKNVQNKTSLKFCEFDLSQLDFYQF